MSNWEFIWKLVSACFIGALPATIYVIVSDINEKSPGVIVTCFWLFVGMIITALIINSYGWIE